MTTESPVDRLHPTLCIGVLTLNEERRLSACLRSAAFADQLVVIDSGSRDRTLEIAREHGADVHIYPEWQGFAVQRNRLLAHVRTDYVFFLDADEEITPELQQELQALVAADQTVVGRVGWLQVAFGRPLTHMWDGGGGGVARFFRRRDLLHFEGEVHEKAVLNQSNPPVYRFKHRLWHYSRETVHGCLQKLSQYVQLGAIRRAKAGKRGGVLRGMASAWAIFVRLYVFRLGFMGGAAGFLFCFFIALECFFRYAAIKYDRDLLSVKMAVRA